MNQQIGNFTCDVFFDFFDADIFQFFHKAITFLELKTIEHFKPIEH